MTIRKVSIGHTQMKKTGFNCGLYHNTLALKMTERMGSQWAASDATHGNTCIRKGAPLKIENVVQHFVEDREVIL